MIAAKPQGSFVKIPGATKIRILFFYLSIISSAGKKKTGNQENVTQRLDGRMKRLIAILLLVFASGCPPMSRRSCNELDIDPSVSNAEYYSHCRPHSAVD